jgi:tRNA A-37 threonylcarbamoyl transferase component Bud32
MVGYKDEMIIADGAGAALEAAGLDSVGRVLRCVGDHTAAWSRTTDTIRVGPGPGQAGPGFFVKRYHYPKAMRRLLNLLHRLAGRRDRARREYEILRRLERRGLPVVRAVATGQRLRFGALRSCLLITECFENASPLDRLASRRIGSFRDRRALIAALARAVAALHREGVVHGQLFWRNVLVRENHGAGYDVRFLDFSPSRRQRRSRPDHIRDLGALGSGALLFCSRSECLRFMCAYLGVDRLDANGRMLMREAARMARGFVRGEERRLELERLFEERVSSTAAATTATREP